jgi:hypothetical protein
MHDEVLSERVLGDWLIAAHRTRDRDVADAVCEDIVPVVGCGGLVRHGSEWAVAVPCWGGNSISNEE